MKGMNFLILFVSFVQFVGLWVYCLGLCTSVSRRARRNVAKQQQIRISQSPADPTTSSPGAQAFRCLVPNQQPLPIGQAEKVTNTGTTYTTEAKEKTEAGTQSRAPLLVPSTTNKPPIKSKNEVKSSKKNKNAEVITPVDVVKPKTSGVAPSAAVPAVPVKESGKKCSGRVNKNATKLKSSSKRKKTPAMLNEVTAESTKKKSRNKSGGELLKVSTAEPLREDKKPDEVEHEDEEETMALVKSLDEDPAPSHGEGRKRPGGPVPEL